jgi:hypothetical protein
MTELLTSILPALVTANLCITATLITDQIITAWVISALRYLHK